MKMKEESIGELEERQRENKRLQAQKQELLNEVSRAVWNREKQIEDWQRLYVSANSELTEQERSFCRSEELEKAFDDYMQGRMPSNLESLKNGTFRKIKQAENSRKKLTDHLWNCAPNI